MIPAAGKRLLSRGFTLIELLVVITVIGVLSAGVFVAINPLKRINQANDAKVKNDIGQIAQALQAYYTEKQTYPTTGEGTGALVTNLDLKSVPIAPTGYTYSYSSCSTAPCDAAAVSGTIKQPAITGNTLWCWRSATATAAEATSCAP